MKNLILRPQNRIFILLAIIGLLLLLVFLQSHKTINPQTEPPLQTTKKLLSLKCSKPRSTSPITHVMLHFCSYAIENPTNPYRFEDIFKTFETYGVSAHYLIDREGQIYQLVEENRVAYHAGKGHLPHEAHRQNDLNGRSIGIEMMAIGTKKEMKMFMSEAQYEQIPKDCIGFTEAQYKSLNLLLADIRKRHSTISYDRKHIVGHDEYAPTRRSDPGSLFDWKKIGL
ncbi:N-acetylmuramoyl-L-alanine amidase [Hugenholtzia roseola]|uniref:N-acetylmuramoyl-L-alanine amidase n=1 Tax=Hugenholtzia roseola TaxID=1002 RepID=UPI0012B58D33|nr:N-acetylmuramoyl-L-alanine amidase [Hugenholtzia roseola]